MILIFMELNFMCKRKILARLKKETTLALTCLVMKMDRYFPIFVSEEKFENSMYLLLVFNDDKSHYVYIKDFDRYMFHKTKNKNKNRLFKSCL